jgi:hypothetical protein
MSIFLFSINCFIYLEYLKARNINRKIIPITNKWYIEKSPIVFLLKKLSNTIARKKRNKETPENKESSTFAGEKNTFFRCCPNSLCEIGENTFKKGSNASEMKPSHISLRLVASKSGRSDIKFFMESVASSVNRSE